MAPALLSKDKKQRPKVSSHFKLAEVTLEALNDPLPKAMTIPSLESLPSEGEGQFRPFRNPVEEDPSAAATISNYPSFKSGLMQKQTIYYPHVTNETRRLLSEVANIRKQYEHRSINELAADPPPIVTTKVVAKKTKKLKKVSNQVVMMTKEDTNLHSSTSNHHQKSYPLKKRIVTHVDSVSFGLRSSASVSQSKNKSSDKLGIGKVTSENGVKDEESNQATLSNISEDCFSKEQQHDFKEVKPDHHGALQSAKDCQGGGGIDADKPWRKNMKVKQENDEEKETKVPEEEQEDKMKMNPKPWRHNMKPSFSVEKAKPSEPIEEATEDVSCHVRTRPTRDHEKVKKFIKDKRRKASEERKAQQEDSRRKKIQVQERLLALDAFRKTQDIMAKTNQQSTSDVVLRLRKQEEEDQLKIMLQKLTDEMKAQHYYPGHEEGGESTLLPEPEEHMLSPTPVKENTKLTSSYLLVTEEEAAKTNISTKNNSEKSVAISQLENSRTPPPQLVGKPKTDFKSQLEKISVKHKEVINTIKACEPDLIVTPRRRPIKPPKQPLKMPDNFNVMSSAMRQSQSYYDDHDKDPQCVVAAALEDKSSDLTVSEGPLLSDCSESTVSKSKKAGSKSATNADMDDIPVRDSSTPIQKIDDQQVPLALQLRFQAELNQMESIQEAERQLHQINQMRDVVTARNETAIYAQALVYKDKASNLSKGKRREEEKSRRSSSSNSRETRSQFEDRMRRELQDLFSSRMAELMQHQVEATKMTVEAANRLTKLQQTKNQKISHRKTRSSSKTGFSSNNEDIKSIISKTESSIPEILNVVEATDRSAKDIQRSIKTAIEELSFADNSKASNITEEIMAELTDDFSSKKSSDKNNDDDDDDTSCSSSSWLTGNLFLQHLEDQRVRDKQQYTMIKRREKVLTLKTKEALKDINEQRREFASDESKVSGLGSKEKKIRKKYRKQKNELANLLQSLQVAEKERQLLFRQHKKLSTFKIKDWQSASSSKMSTASSDHSGSSSAISNVISEDIQAVQELASTTTKKTSSSASAATIKTPLSPKRTSIRQLANRRRHSSAESEDSISFISTSQVETVSSAGDQSDLELRVHTLKDELKEREKTAARLKKQQKLARQERLKAQEEALKKQIEVYDNIIQQTKSDIEVNISASSSSAASSPASQSRITQPQIKIPKQQSRTATESPLSCETISTPQASLSIDEESTSTDTIIASPQKPATPANIDEVPNEAANWSSGHNNNYSDDFTSSLSSNPPTPAAKLASEKSVDTLCGQLLEAMIEDTVGRMKTKQEAAKLTGDGQVEVDAGDAVNKSLSRPKSKSPPVVNHMQTTFDVSSESSEEEEEVAKETTEDDTTVAPDELPDEQSALANTGGDGDFIDDDFGLSLKKEWDHLRQQQMLIEEEISNIQKDSVEASKPPPPYSPPTIVGNNNLEGQRSPRKLAVQVKPESPRFVPSSKDQLSVLVDNLVDHLLQNRNRLDEMNIEADKLIECLALPPDQLDKESQRIFVRFLFDLTKDIMKEVYSVEKEDQNPAWMRQKSLSFGIRNIPANTEELQALVRRRVLVAFHHEKRAAKENLIIRWSHKRRDRVDQVLVRELHGEESTWIDYEADEIHVKDELSNTLLDSLISDTVQAFKKVPAVAFVCQA